MTGSVDATLDDAAEVFTTARRRLFGIAYRMLGSAAEAEDVVQETWVRWQTTDRSVVVNPQAFLTTAATRLAINVLQSARSRRETYVGPWLPEPVDTSEDPTLGAERAEALDVALLMLLERLTPTERAAYVLREAFGYAYPEIARIVGVSPAATRQLVSRARKHLASERRHEVDATVRRELLAAFLAAARAGDVERLEQLLAEDAVSRVDSNGGIKHVARVAVVGRAKVARVLSSFAETFWANTSVFPLMLNGEAAFGFERDGELFGVLSITASDQGVQEALWQMNPEKLELLRRAREGRAAPEGSS
ncbi:RNA polymerase sigma-70 factor [Promicromonospora sp. NPDC060271]|uniref:RNA polymerase sigma-70 factor n=1 Tax=Promicromonospora sp. NPDC060271 TaxID=3347089 RepID=UPI003663C2F0